MIKYALQSSLLPGNLFWCGSHEISSLLLYFMLNIDQIKQPWPSVKMGIGLCCKPPLWNHTEYKVLLLSGHPRVGSDPLIAQSSPGLALSNLINWHEILNMACTWAYWSYVENTKVRKNPLPSWMSESNLADRYSSPAPQPQCQQDKNHDQDYGINTCTPSPPSPRHLCLPITGLPPPSTPQVLSATNTNALAYLTHSQILHYPH